MLQARKDFIFVKTVREDKANGLYIPPAFKQGMDNYQLGKVVCHGEKARVQTDDVIVFDKNHGESFHYQGEDLLKIKMRSIFAIK